MSVMSERYGRVERPAMEGSWTQMHDDRVLCKVQKSYGLNVKRPLEIF